MTLRIGRLHMRLPAAYAGRAGAIARAVAQAAAGIPLAQSRRFDTLALGPVRVAEGATDAEVAAAVAQRLAARMEKAP